MTKEHQRTKGTRHRGEATPPHRAVLVYLNRLDYEWEVIGMKEVHPPWLCDKSRRIIVEFKRIRDLLLEAWRHHETDYPRAAVAADLAQQRLHRLSKQL